MATGSMLSRKNHSNRAHFPLHRIVISVAFDIADIRFVLDILYKTFIDCIGFIISLFFLIVTTFIFVLVRNPSSCDWKETAGLSWRGVLRQSSDDPATLSPLERLLGCVRSKLPAASLLSRCLWRTELWANQVMRPNLVVGVVGEDREHAAVPRRTNDHEFRRCGASSAVS
jgi:hypothetical protein